MTSSSSRSARLVAKNALPADARATAGAWQEGVRVGGAETPEPSAHRTALALTKPARLYISEAILTELSDVLARPRLGIAKARRRQLLDLIESRAFVVKTSRRVEATQDPADHIFLECPEAARADYLVTGNIRHFPAFWKWTKVVSPRELLTLAAPHLMP